MKLIDADELKKSTCDKGVCSDCEDFHKGNNVATNCSEIRWYFLEKINEQPTVDAVPISFIQQRIDHLHKLAEYEFEYNGGYVGATHIAWHELEKILIEWEEERDANQDKTD